MLRYKNKCHGKYNSRKLFFVLSKAQALNADWSDSKKEELLAPLFPGPSDWI